MPFANTTPQKSNTSIPVSTEAMMTGPQDPWAEALEHAIEAKKDNRNPQGDLEKAREHPLVRLIVEKLDGEIVDVLSKSKGKTASPMN